jgi:hypothetical protein
MTIRADRNGVLNYVGTAVREGVHVVLATTKPTIAIISDGDGNTYGHPTEDCLERLHSVGTKTYWTEHGNGAEPAPGWDTVSGTSVVSVDLAAGQYKVAHGTTSDTYAIGGGAVGQGTGTGSSASYAWSKRSGTYHYSTCDWVKRISAENLVTGTTPPEGKALHQDCPTHHQN